GASQSGPGFHQSAGPTGASQSGPGYSQSVDFAPPPAVLAVGGAALVATAADNKTSSAPGKFSCSGTCGGVAFSMSASCPSEKTPVCQCQAGGGVVVCK